MNFILCLKYLNVIYKEMYINVYKADLPSVLLEKKAASLGKRKKKKIANCPVSLGPKKSCLQEAAGHTSVTASLLLSMPGI